VKRLAAILALLFLARTGLGQAIIHPAGELKPNSGKDCAVCHVEWVSSFDEPQAVNLIARPTKPLAAESETCLGCHDGSVADSRREVWLEHSHKTGVMPPKEMKVPEGLPLEDGRLACRTCHTAHANKESGSLKDAVFLRMPNEMGQMCKACHADKSGGPETGTHPLAEMKFELPKELAAAGSHAGPANKQVVCQTCHGAHGTKADHLLVMGTESSQLCLSCHEKVRPAMWAPDAPHEHPQNPPLRTDAQRKAIKDMGTHAGADGTMICLSCHKLHHGQAGRAMLADTLTNSALCLRCHPERQDMANSQHDLRKSAPKEPNRRNETPEQSGPCGACHSFHTYARTPEPGKADPQGLCITCHSDNKVAAKHTGQPFSHPAVVPTSLVPRTSTLKLYPGPTPDQKIVACLSCHNPHDVKQKHFLRNAGDDLCASCHDQKVQQLAGKHDFTKSPELKNGRGLTGAETGKCGYCHAVHNANGPAMWVATANRPKSPEALCAECHRVEGVAKEKSLAKFNHPVGAAARPTTRPANLPLFTLEGHLAESDGVVSCGSCHDIHADASKTKSLLRAGATEPAALCLNCHAEKSAMADGPHDYRRSARKWPETDLKSGDLCTSCHIQHSNDEKRTRWALAPASGVPKGDGECVACHAENSWSLGKDPIKTGSMIHPRTAVDQIAMTKLSPKLPLASSAPNRKDDAIACKTCHNPHAGAGTPSLLRVATHEPARAICITCHDIARSSAQSMHSHDLVDPKNASKNACGPCHSAHAASEKVQRPFLWAAEKGKGGDAEEQLCTGCHGAGGSAKRANIFRHHPADFKNVTSAALSRAATRPATQPATDPLFAIGQIDHMTCATCHLPHGRFLDAPAGVTPASKRMSGKPMMRPNVDRDICSLCHDFDSTRVYLYWHDAKKRAQMQKYTQP
jgi:predicted CXXCH cytochrome family protein